MLNGFYTICPARRNRDCIHNTLYHQGRRATLKDAVEDISYSAATMVKHWRVVGRLLIWQVALLWMLFRALRAVLALVSGDYSTRSLTCFVNCGKALGVLWLWSDHMAKTSQIKFLLDGELPLSLILTQDAGGRQFNDGKCHWENVRIWWHSWWQNMLMIEMMLMTHIDLVLLHSHCHLDGLWCMDSLARGMACSVA